MQNMQGNLGNKNFLQKFGQKPLKRVYVRENRYGGMAQIQTA
jgi:hypothetical protein